MDNNNKDNEFTKGVRFNTLKQVGKKALEKLIKNALNIDKVIQCYPKIASTQQGVYHLKGASAQIIDYWYSSTLSELDLIYGEKEVEQRLDELDEIIQIAKQRKQLEISNDVHIDKLDANDIINCNIVTEAKESLDKLNAIYNQLVTENEELLQSLTLLCNEANNIYRDITTLSEPLTKESEISRQEIPRVREIIQILQERVNRDSVIS